MPRSSGPQFLDAQRINQLTTYLQALHTGGRVSCQARYASSSRAVGAQAKGEHTTLLLNCYTKLKDTEKLNQFIRSESISFDVKTAIRVLREVPAPLRTTASCATS